MITASLASTILLLPADWLSLDATRTDLMKFFLFNPSLVIGTLLFFWLGFEWGFIPIYLSSFIIAFHSAMPWNWALVFGISFVLGLAICAMAYQGFKVSYNLRSLKSIAFFISIFFIASIASSLGAFIWSFIHQLSAFETLAIWKSWWSGTFLQALLLTGPLLFFLSPPIERLKKRWLQVSKNQDVSMRWIVGAVISITGALIFFVFSGRILGKLRIQEVIAESRIVREPDIIGALESFEIIIWISIGLILVTGYGAIYLINSWNKNLSEEVSKKTEKLNKSQKKLQKSLDDKKVLLKEIHHRVKNNMAQVGALLELQQKFSSNEEEMEILKTARSRIRSMALAHEALYENNTFSSIPLNKYVKNIGQLTYKSFLRPDTDIEMAYDLDETYIDMKDSIPLGIFMNEILINAFKHAFKGKDRGKITISSTTDHNKLTLVVSDDGVGIEEKNKQGGTGSLGMNLVKTLARQLKGDLDISSAPGEGTTFTITFAHTSPASQNDPTQGK